jgi:hypothetical protein
VKYVWRIWGPVLGMVVAIFAPLWLFTWIFGYWGAAIFGGVLSVGILVWITTVGVADMKAADERRRKHG